MAGRVVADWGSLPYYAACLWRATGVAEVSNWRELSASAAAPIPLVWARVGSIRLAIVITIYTSY
jgi:hypothetical protein